MSFEVEAQKSDASSCQQMKNATNEFKSNLASGNLTGIINGQNYTMPEQDVSIVDITPVDVIPAVKIIHPFKLEVIVVKNNSRKSVTVRTI